MDTSKKIITFGMILILILLIFSLQHTMAKDDNNENSNVVRLYNNYQRHKVKFLELAIERLHESISKDKILSAEFYSNDSLLFKKLKVYINPLVKLKREAINYTYNDDISEYMELDTINYDCVAGFFLDDTLCFNVARGHNECDFEIITYGRITPDWCPDKYYFYQHYYQEEENQECLKHEIRVIKDSNFVFGIDGLNRNYFTIKDGKLKIYPSSERVVNVGMLDRPNEFIRITYQKEIIRRSARNCPLSKTKKY